MIAIIDRLNRSRKMQSTARICLKFSLGKMGKKTTIRLQLKFVENPICFWMQYSAKLTPKIELTLPKSQKVKAFFESTVYIDLP